MASQIEATKLAPTSSGSLFKVLEDHPLPGPVDDLNFFRKIRFRLPSTGELELVEPLTAKNLRLQGFVFAYSFPNPAQPCHLYVLAHPCELSAKPVWPENPNVPRFSEFRGTLSRIPIVEV